MNWLQKTSYIDYNTLQDATAKIQGVIQNTEDGSPNGVVAQMVQQIGPDPSVCQAIMAGCAADVSAPKKMKILSDAAGCEWKPEMLDPPIPEQDNMQPMQMPNLGAQEQPMEMPSSEIG